LVYAGYYLLLEPIAGVYPLDHFHTIRHCTFPSSCSCGRQQPRSQPTTPTI
jgi:hypothetical protein